MSDQVESTQAADVQVRLPIEVIARVVAHAESTSVAATQVEELGWPFAVVYEYVGEDPNKRPEGALYVQGFQGYEQASEWLEQTYRSDDRRIVAVLRDGKPVEFKLTVKARIGR